MEIIIDNLIGKMSVDAEFNINATQSTDLPPIFETIGSEYIIKLEELDNVKKISKFSYDTLSMTKTRYLNTFYRISLDGRFYSEWFDLNRNVENHYDLDPNSKLYLEIKWVRVGKSEISNIKLLNYHIELDLERNIVDDGGYTNVKRYETKIIKAPYIYKVFKITDLEIITPLDNLDDINFKFRFSQDNSRTWSNWEDLTKENITTIKINPIRFFQIEYSVENNKSKGITIQDINLIGEFQNVSKDYFKSNLFGIRECCQSNLLNDSNSNMLSSDNCDPNTLPNLNSDDKNKLYQPYQQTAAVNLLSKLSEDAQSMFGFKVIYFCTDPDKNGEDKSLNEYQLYNVVCDHEIKVSVDGNNFPDNQITMNQFDLSLFESMQVHITKKQFKEIFGPQRRPAKEDFLYFCDVNRMFIVDHAQQYRGFNNTSVYYKLILKKYNKSSNVAVTNQETQNLLAELTNNSTVSELFGDQIELDKKSVANKDQLKTLTLDPIRLQMNARIDKELIENSTTIVSKSNYDLSSVTFGETAVEYLNTKNYYKVSDNFSYMCWFNMNNYLNDETYNLFNYYDDVNNIGWSLDILNDNIIFKINDLTYTTPLGFELYEEVWYSFLINANQRERYMETYIYKRSTDNEKNASRLSSAVLTKMHYEKKIIDISEFEIEDIKSRLIGSDMKITNIRLFNDIIPENTHHKILNQYIIGDDSKYLIFADNATNRLYLPNYPNFQ